MWFSRPYPNRSRVVILSNDILTDQELDKVYVLYADYGPERLGDFIRMVWKEAHELGRKDGYVDGYNDHKMHRNRQEADHRFD